MSDLFYTLLADGSSDKALLRHLTWLLEQNVPPEVAIQPQWADLSLEAPRPRNLAERVAAAVRLYPCDLLFVHRDAERQSRSVRQQEILGATLQMPVPIIPVIPVRMQEAWLLFDEAAIRFAAGNPRGDQRLNLPRLQDVEDVADPKMVLHQCLRQACGLHGRRLRRFQPHDHALRVADYIDSFAPLRALSAFSLLETDIRQFVGTHDWT